MKLSLILVTLALAVSAIEYAKAEEAGCTLNGVLVPGDPELIEGTDDPDVIDCRTSESRHDILASSGADTVYGSPYDDFIAGGGGNDIIYAGDGNDSVDGGGNDDTILGEGGNDVLFGGVGSAPAAGVGCELQTAFIAAGSSYLTKGGSGDDAIWGGTGDDCIDAGSGEDEVYGEEGNDTLEGGNHSDLLDGGPGNDYIDGGWHSDTCIGGGDSDNYVSCESIQDSPPPPADCGNGTCEAGEECSCEEDCPVPDNETLWCSDGLDNDCDSYADCTDILDCGSAPACTSGSCGNGICEAGEDCGSCSLDCDEQTNGRPRNRYCCGNGIKEFKEERDTLCNGNW